MLHMWELPDFGELDVGHARALGQHDAELLLSYLTVPYLRIPLVVSFFASDDRIHSLQSPKLQALLDAALFEPGNHLPLDSPASSPSTCPPRLPRSSARRTTCCSTSSRARPTRSSPASLASQACDLDTGTLKSSTATVILYVSRLCARIDNVRLDAARLRRRHARRHRRQAGIAAARAGRAACAEKLGKAQAELRGAAVGRADAGCCRRGTHKLVRECEHADDDHVLDANTKHMCNIHAHLLLMMRNAKAGAHRGAHRDDHLRDGLPLDATRVEHGAARQEGRLVARGWRMPENRDLRGDARAAAQARRVAARVCVSGRARPCDGLRRACVRLDRLVATRGGRGP